MTYSQPAVERKKLAGMLAAPSTCDFVKCTTGHICVDGQCVPIT